LRFPGQYYDPETGLHHNYFRYYDPETARFLTLDPLGLDSAPNPVAYVDNPHTLCDPLGLAPSDEADVTWGGRVQ
jgi:RHS repeat-associated protein